MATHVQLPRAQASSAPRRQPVSSSPLPRALERVALAIRKAERGELGPLASGRCGRRGVGGVTLGVVAGRCGESGVRGVPLGVVAWLDGGALAQAFHSRHIDRRQVFNQGAKASYSMSSSDRFSVRAITCWTITRFCLELSAG